MDAVFMEGRIGQVVDKFGVVGPLDELLCCKAVGEEVIEGRDTADNQGCPHMLEDITPGSAVPQVVNGELSAKLAKIVPFVYLVTWLGCHPVLYRLYILLSKTLANLQSLYCSGEFY